MAGSSSTTRIRALMFRTPLVKLAPQAGAGIIAVTSHSHALHFAPRESRADRRRSRRGPAAHQARPAGGGAHGRALRRSAAGSHLVVELGAHARDGRALQ